MHQCNATISLYECMLVAVTDVQPCLLHYHATLRLGWSSWGSSPAGAGRMQLLPALSSCNWFLPPL